MTDFSKMSDEELDSYIAGAEQQQPAPAPMGQQTATPDFASMSDEELDAFIARGESAAPASQVPRRMTREERIAANRRAIEVASNPTEDDERQTAAEPFLEGVRGAGRAVKAIGAPFVGLASGVARLAGTPVRMATGWSGLHRLADTIDEGYANWGSGALSSDYGENPEGAGFAIGRAGEKMAGIAGSLGSLMTPGAVAKLGNAPAALRTAGAAVQKMLPAMFGNDAAVRTYDTAVAADEQQGIEPRRARALALASVNGAIHFFGFKLFENQSLNKMLGMPQSMEAAVPKMFDAARKDGANTFNGLVDGVRNGMFKYIVAERGKGALKAGGIMGLQNFLSSIPTQVAEGGDVDLSRALKEGLGGVEEGALMEGLLGGAAMLKTPRDARRFASEMVRHGYDVRRPDGSVQHMPGLLQTPEGRMFVVKQNPELQSRIIDIAKHGGKVSPEELNAACLPPDMKPEELKRFAADWDADLAVEENRGESAALGEGDEMVARTPNEDSPDVPAKIVRERQEEAEMGDRLEHQFDDANRKADDAYNQVMLEREEARAAAKPAVEPPKPSETPRQETPDETRNGADEAQARPQEGTARPEAAAEAPRPVEAEPPRAEAADAGSMVALPGLADGYTAERGQGVNSSTTFVYDADGNIVGAVTDNGRRFDKNAAKFVPEGERAPWEKPPEPEPAPSPAEAAAEPKVGEDTPRSAEGVEAASRVSYATPEREAPVAEAENAPLPSFLAPDEAPAKEAPAAKPAEKTTAKRESAAKTTAPVPAERKWGTNQELWDIVENAVAPGEETTWGEIMKRTGLSLSDMKHAFAMLRLGRVNVKSKWAQSIGLDESKKVRRVSEGGDGSAAPAPRLADAPKPAEPAPAPTGEVSSPEPTPAPAKRGKGRPTMTPEQKAASAVSRAAEKARSLIDISRSEDGSLSADKFKVSKNNPGGLSLKELEGLKADKEWHRNLGLPEKDADALRAAVEKAHDDKYLEYHYQSAHDKFADYERGDGDLAFAYNAVSDAASRAKKKGDTVGEQLLQPMLKSLTDKIGALPKNEQNKILAKSSREADTLAPKERKNRKSLTTKEGKEVDVATSGEVAEAGEAEEAPDEYGAGSRFNRIEANDDDSSGRSAPKGATGTGGSLGGNRHLIIDGVKGDELTVTMKDAAGKTLATRKMTRAQWAALANGADAVDGDPAAPQKGDLIRMSRNGESPAERNLRFASDENYQKWLKSRKANDAEPLRERYEQEQAKAAKSIAKNALPGVDVEIVDRAFNPETDGGNRYLRDGEGRVVGTFDRSTNKVKLYRGASAATLVHELGGHATLRFAEQEAERGNRQLLDRINRAIDEAPQTLKDEIRSRYPGVDETALRDEIWAALRERNSPAMEKAIKTLQGKAWYNRAWSAFRDAWKGLLARMGFNRADLSQIDRMSNDEFLSHLDRIMSDGKTLGRLEAMGEGTRNAVRKGVSAAEDAAYMDAVKRGDMETAQRMVDEAAERSGYGKIGFHGTKYKHGQFTKFAKGSHVGSEIYQALSRIGVDVDSLVSKGQIKRIVEDLKANGKDILSLRVALKNPLRVSDFGESWHGLEFVRKLYAEHPDLFSPVEWDRLAKNPTLAHEMIEAKGYDGLVYDNTSEGILDYSGDTPGRYDAKGEYIPNDAYIPFHASQIKSAEPVTYDNAGNVIPLSQRFDPQSDDIRYSRSPRPAGSRIMDDQQTKGEKFTEKFIDSLAPVKSVQDELGGVKEITRADGYTDHTKSTDLVAAKDKANGRLEHEVRQHQFRVDDINRDLSRAALPKQSTEELVNDFNLYLQCKHAPERNLSVAQDRGDTYTPDYSEGMGQITLPGGNRIGLSENVADRLLKGMRGKYGLKFKMFENAADKVYKMLEADLDRRFDAGRLSAEDYAFYKTRWHGPGGADGKWAHYVPLKTDMERLEPEALNSSTAGMKRNEFMKAQGRGTGDIADSPLAAAVLQTEQGIRGSIRNEVANVEANLVEHAQKQGIPIAEIVPGDEIRRGRTYSFTFADGETVDASGSMRLVENHPEIHLFKRDGKLYAIRYDKGANGRGLAFARAASGENMGRWGQGTEWIPRMTHWMSAMRTQYSPEFTVSNWLADHLEAAQALVGRYGLKEGGKAFAKTVASEIQNWKDLRAYLKDGTANGYIKEFVEGGGLTKGGVASEGFDAETQKIRSKIEQFRRKQKQWREMSPADLAKSAGRHVADFLSFANELAEYSTRTGLYTALRKQGVPRADAIKFARDATVNFNRKGTAMPYINGLYMFANASVQGAVRSVQAMRDAHGKELIAALTAIGVAKAVIDNYLGNDDEREAAGGRNARNQSEYDKKHNVGVPIGGGRQIVPLRFRGPYAAVPYLAQTAANVAMGATSPEDGAKTLFRELGDQVTDLVGGNGIMNDKGELDGSLIGQSIAPSVADPIVQLATGKDYKGEERRQKSFDKTMPASSNGKRNTGDWYKVAAQTLNRMSGGNEHRKGLVDVAPEDLQLVLEFLGGAPMRDINNVASSVNNAVQLASGGTPERTLSQIPFVRRVVREYPESTSRYYDALEDYERDKAEFKKTTPERRKEMKADKPYLFTGKSLLDGQIERIKELTHLERGEVKVGQKWVEPKTPRTEEQKEKYRKLRLEMQARVLKRLGE